MIYLEIKFYQATNMLSIHWMNTLNIYCCQAPYRDCIGRQARLSSSWPPRADGLVKTSRRKQGSSPSPCSSQPASLGRGQATCVGRWPRSLTRACSSGKGVLTEVHWEHSAVFLVLTHCSTLRSQFDVSLLLEKKGGESKDHKMAFSFCHFSK